MSRLSSLKTFLLLLTFILSGTNLHAAFDSKTLPETGGQSAGFSSFSTPDPAIKREKYKEGELLVKFRSGIAEDRKKNLHKKHGAEKLKEFDKLRLHHVKLKKGMEVEEAQKRYQADPEVEYAEPNFEYSALAQPNDPRFGELWGLQNIGQTGGKTGADIKAQQAWDLTTGSSEVVVAVIDSGIDYTHPDLAGNIWSNPGMDYFNNDADPFDDHGHGTHVAGTIGAVGNDGTGVVGVNWNVKLTACKFLSAMGNGYTDGAIQCLQYLKGLKDAGANIVATNNSWGGGAYSQALYDAINNQRDILFIASAGNKNFNADLFPSYPASYDLPNVISVAATDASDDLAYFSYFGRRSVDLGAPGVDILSTLPASNYWLVTGGYGTLSGTSMAAPHVTGVAALLKAQQPGRDWREIRNLILSGGEPVPPLRDRTVTGRRLSAAGSLGCSNQPLLVPLSYPELFPLPLGQAITLSALSVNCGAAAGPVTVTTPDGEVVTLRDDGAAPDLAEGDGIYAASWTPVSSGQPRSIEEITFSSPAGTVQFPPLRLPRYLPEANLRFPYQQFVEASGGTPPYQWSLGSGGLPAGLALNGATGELAGTPAATGSYSFELRVADAQGRSRTKTYTLLVAQDQVQELRAMSFEDHRLSGPKFSALDGSGNVYVTGVLKNGAGNDFITVKYDRLGRELWSASYDAGGNEAGVGVALDGIGNVYVTGSGAGNMQTLKYGPAGNLLWVRSYDSGKLEYAQHVAVDASGNVYVAGLAASGSLTDSLLVKYDPAGNLLWTKTYNSAEKDETYGLGLDGAGNVYVTGNRSFLGADYKRQYQYQTLKYAADGTLLWARTYEDVSGNVVTVGQDGSVYAAGVYSLVKYDAGGTQLWGKKVPVNGNDIQMSGLEFDDQGYLYVTGTYSTSTGYVYILAKLDQDGNVIWSRPVTGDFRDYLLSVLSVAGSAIYVSRPHDATMLTSVFVEAPVLERLPVGVRGKPYSETLAVLGGVPPYTVSSAGGTLPPGLELDYPTRTISGIPIAAGSFSFSVTLQEAGGAQKTVQVTLEVQEPLSLSFSGTGSGSVLFSNGAGCSGDCSFSFPSGTLLTLTASPAVSSQFSGWAGACSESGVCSVTMDGAKEIGAGFAIRSTTLTVNQPWSGSGAVQLSDGASCSGNCSRPYDWGTELTLSAVPAPGSIFLGWGGACSGTGSCSVLLEGDRLVFAKFQQAGPDLQSIGTGTQHSVALRNDGTLMAWGYNGNGELGDGSTLDRGIPAPVPGFDGVVTLAVGAGVNLAIREDGTLWSWGDSSSGQLGVSGSDDRLVPQPVPGLGAVSAVAVGGNHSAAIGVDGSVWTWGSNATGALGDGTTTTRMTPVRAGALSAMVALAGGGSFTTALSGDGTLWGWGRNDTGQLGDGTLEDRLSPVPIPGLSGVVAVASGAFHSIALKNDGTVWGWGSNYLGQVGTGPRGIIVAPVQIPGLAEVVAIALGSHHSMALKADGTVWAWGANNHGQLGDGSNMDRSAPFQVPGVAGIAKIAAGGFRSFALQRDGRLLAWGSDSYGSLGDGGSTDQPSAQPITLPAAPPLADFAGSVLTGQAPLLVKFSNLSLGAPASWLWDFGDLSTGSAHEPRHLYGTPGSYSVTLSATNPAGSDTRTRTSYITVLACPNLPVRIAGAIPASFADLPAAYAQALDSDLIQLQAFNFSGNFDFDREVSVALKGGYDCGYSEGEAGAGISGKLTVTRGTVKLGNIRFQ
jgi:alpha-tubulin suppressor-like RCC1 family protein/subtilisin family serine protease